MSNNDGSAEAYYIYEMEELSPILHSAFYLLKGELQYGTIYYYFGSPCFNRSVQCH